MGTTTDRTSPGRVYDLGDTVNLTAVGAFSVCARRIDGSVWCWGDNRFGQLGLGNTVQRSRPVEVTSQRGATAMRAGPVVVHCFERSGRVYCAGDKPRRPALPRPHRDRDAPGAGRVVRDGGGD
jgi:alpha-tubulin suppressor-like RCC1 family protein